jgi:hypothetical protein
MIILDKPSTQPRESIVVEPFDLLFDGFKLSHGYLRGVLVLADFSADAERCRSGAARFPPSPGTA